MLSGFAVVLLVFWSCAIFRRLILRCGHILRVNFFFLSNQKCKIKKVVTSAVALLLLHLCCSFFLFSRRCSVFLHCYTVAPLFLLAVLLRQLGLASATPLLFAQRGWKVAELQSSARPRRATADAGRGTSSAREWSFISKTTQTHTHTHLRTHSSSNRVINFRREQFLSPEEI